MPLAKRFQPVPPQSYGVGLMLSSILFISWITVPAFAQTVPAAPAPLPTGPVSLPDSVRDRLLTSAAQDLGLPKSSLCITKVTQVVWPNPCLGVLSPGELCAAVQTPGWRVELFDGEAHHVYRTDEQAQEIRAEPPPSADIN